MRHKFVAYLLTYLNSPIVSTAVWRRDIAKQQTVAVNVWLACLSSIWADRRTTKGYYGM